MTTTRRHSRQMARSRRKIAADAARHRVVRTGTVAGSVALLLTVFIVTGLGMSSRPAASPSPSPRLAAVAPTATPAAAATATATPTADPTPSPSPIPEPSAQPEPTDPAVQATPTPTPTPDPTPTPEPTPTASPPPGAAPTSAEDFNRRNEVVPLAWPLSKGTSFRYRNNYHEGRSGLPESYNHWFSRTNGVLRRAHDGVDIYARRGARALSPLSGTVIDPSTRWKPWRPDRYGRVVVIVSDEPTSMGYTAILAHMDKVVVSVGDHVRRGQYIGTVGVTGNAAGGPPHIHFELRAPFQIGWSELGKWRLVDAFNPYWSLRKVAPRR